MLAHASSDRLATVPIRLGVGCRSDEYRGNTSACALKANAMTGSATSAPEGRQSSSGAGGAASTLSTTACAIAVMTTQPVKTRAKERPTVERRARERADLRGRPQRSHTLRAAAKR